VFTYLWDELHQEELSHARSVLGEEAFERLAARGAALDPEDFSRMLLREIDATLEQLPAT
jgi:hypothetical protein